jgi:hypothetical protein
MAVHPSYSLCVVPCPMELYYYFFSIFLVNIPIIVGNIGLKQVNIPIIVGPKRQHFNANSISVAFNRYGMVWNDPVVRLNVGSSCYASPSGLTVL